MVASNSRGLVKIKNLRNERIVANQCVVAKSFSQRAKGLIGTRNFQLGQGLLLTPCRSIHMWMMSIAIDAVFLKRDQSGSFVVTSVWPSLKPWRLFPITDLRADDVLELPCGALEAEPIQVGDLLCIS